MIAGWKADMLGNLVEVKGGKRLPKGEKLVDIPTGYPYIRVTDFENFTVNISGLKFLESRIQQKIKNYIIKKEDAFISIAGTIGFVGKIPNELDGANLTENAARLVIRKRNELDRDFLVYFLSAKHTQTDVLSRMSKNAQPKLSLSNIKSIEISLPPLPEQRNIALALNTVQTAIEQQDRLIKTTTELKKTLMQKLFTEGIKGEKQKQTEIGLVPESWEIVKLGAIVDIKGGFAFKSEDSIPNSNTQLLRMGNLYQNTLDLDRAPIFYPDDFQKKHPNFVLKEGDLVMSLTGTMGKEDYGFTVKLPRTSKVLLLNQRIGKFEIKDNSVSKDYLKCYLLSRVFLDKLYKTAKGTKQANLSSNEIKTLLFLKPSIAEQKAIARQLRLLEQKIEFHGKKKQALSDLFKTLLHELMTGQRRVHEVELENEGKSAIFS